MQATCFLFFGRIRSDCANGTTFRDKEGIRTDGNDSLPLGLVTFGFEQGHTRTKGQAVSLAVFNS